MLDFEEPLSPAEIEEIIQDEKDGKLIDEFGADDAADVRSAFGR